MKKRNFYLLGLFIVSICAICTFLSCKSYHSSPYAVVEETVDGTCTYTYPKYDKDDKDNKTILRYCFTECTRCPSQADINDFNVSKEGKETLSNKLCPLTEENTHYLDYDKMPRAIRDYIGNSSDLKLKKLKEEFKTVYENINNSTVLTVDSKDIDNNNSKDVDNNKTISNYYCSRDFLFAKYDGSSSSSGIILKDSTNDDEKLLEEYGFATYTYEYDHTDTSIKKKYAVLTHAKDGKPTQLWLVDLDRRTFQNTKEEYEAFKSSGWRFASVNDCNQDFAKLIHLYVMYYLKHDKSRSWKSRFWLSDIHESNDKDEPDMHKTCLMWSNPISLSVSQSQDSTNQQIFLIKDKPSSFKSETFESFKDAIDRNFKLFD